MININELIRNRRSIQPAMFKDEVIDDDIVLQILENANWAPNHKKTEPWRFVIFKDEGLKKLAEYNSNQYKLVTPEESYSEFKFKKTQKKVLSCSHVIAICMRRSVDVKIPEWEEIAAVSCAVQNLWLSCSTYGLGGYWSSPKYASHAVDFLGLDENHKCFGYFYLGKPKEGLNLKSERGPIQDKIKWVKS